MLGTNAQLPVFYNYKPGSGLPSNEVYNMLSDRQGYMWFATDRGPARFDGDHFVTYSVNEGVSDNFVDRILISPGGTVWIITNGRDLYRYTGTRFTPYPFNNRLDDLIGRHSMAWLSQVGFDGEQPAVFEIRGVGLIRITQDGRTIFLDPPADGQELRYNAQYNIAYYSDTSHLHGSGATPSGLLFFSFKGNQYKTVRPRTSNCLRRRNGQTLISHGSHLLVLKGDALQHVEEYDNRIINLYEDTEQRLWVSTYGNGVKMYPQDKHPGEAEPAIYFSDTRISAVAQDREGGYWFSSNDKGVLYIPSLNTRTLDNTVLADNEYFQEIGTGEPHTLYAITSKGRIFRSVNGEPLAFYNRAYTTNLNTLCNDIVYDTLTHNLYASFSEKVYIINTATGASQTHPAASRTILPVGKTFYVLSQSSIVYDAITMRGQKIVNTLGNFSGLLNTDGSLLIGTDKGLIHLSGTTATPFGKDSIRQRVTSVKRLSNGTVVAATLGQGLAFIRDKNISLLSLGASNAINMVNEIAIAGNAIWAATEAGVVRVDISAAVPAIRLMAADDRFPQNNTRKIACIDGYVYVLAQNRLIAFRDTPVNPNPQPPVFLEKILVGDSVELKSGQTYPFRYTDNRIRFVFNGISFRAGNLIRYRYRLSGLHTDWYTTAQPYVEYPSLQPGSYTFEVAAVNENGVVSAQPATYTFTIPAPFWKHGWFMILLAGLLAALAWLITRARLKRIQERNREKELLLTKEQVALSAQINPHFVFNSLNSIQHLIIQEDKKSAVLHMAQFSRLMRLSLDNTRKKWVPVNSEIELLKLYLELESLRFRDKFVYHVHADAELLSGNLLIPAMLIQPYVENAVRHGVNNLPGNSGMITVSLHIEGAHLVTRIEDNGVGRMQARTLRDTGTTHQSAGMQITEERLKLLCKETGIEWAFSITDKTDQEGNTSGTLVQFYMPYIRSTQAQYPEN